MGKHRGEAMHICSGGVTTNLCVVGLDAWQIQRGVLGKCATDRSSAGQVDQPGSQFPVRHTRKGSMQQLEQNMNAVVIFRSHQSYRKLCLRKPLAASPKF